MLLGLLALISPLTTGSWSLAIIGLLMVAFGGVELVQALRGVGPERPPADTAATYVTAVVSILAGLLLFFNPLFSLTGLLTLLALFFLVSAVGHLWALRHKQKGNRVWNLFNALVDILLALLCWSQKASWGAVLLGLAFGLWILSYGWSMLFGPDDERPREALELEQSCHPDICLALEPNAHIADLVRAEREAQLRRIHVDVFWGLTLVAVFFAIHLGRMRPEWTFLGMVSPAVAVAGDLAGAFLLTVVFVLPARLFWRKITRPIERSAWARRLARDPEGDVSLGDKLVDLWLDARLRWTLRLQQAYASLPLAIWRGLEAGLPAVALLIAIHPIWGFTWYFNTENWATGFWQMVVAQRVTDWRESMAKAVIARQPSGTTATSPGVFEVTSASLHGQKDFSFLVIGDTGEGDASQHILRDQYLFAGERPEVKFLVVCSDVIYPAGDMMDYEANFYLPFKGFRKPVLALPGNHDWYDALDGFAANFLEPGAAEAAITARVEADLGLSSTGPVRVDGLLARAKYLRETYGIRNGLQRAPFWELHTERFTLLGVDTGILRDVGPTQTAWLRSALERARGRFTMVLLGHPLYAGGKYQAPPPGKQARDVVPAAEDTPGPEGDTEEFGKLHAILREYEVPVVMAGDTHDFEYYRERYEGRSGARTMHHFVNGGGGAYLSIGTALSWPKDPPVETFAYYPTAAAIRSKLSREMPWWKQPVWFWVDRLQAWPSSPETLSAVFNFNRAPFFQSFVEVKVEGSANRVRIVLHGTHGLLPWKELAKGGAVMPPGAAPDDAAEWVFPMR